MSLVEALLCPHCGAALPEHARRGPVTCAYCDATVLVYARTVRAEEFESARTRVLREHRPPSANLLLVEHRVFASEGAVAIGHASQVLLARRADHPSERVIIKLVEDAARAPLDHEWDVVSELGKSDAQGAPHFVGLLPRPVMKGRARHDGKEPFAYVYGYRSGFVHTFEDVRRAHRLGVDADASVWLFRRILELLDFIHRAGFVHGALLPEHLLVHARDHGVVFSGFGATTRIGDAIPRTCNGAAAFYTGLDLDDARPALDIAMAARSLAFVLSGNAHEVPLSVAGPLRDLYVRAIEGEERDAQALHERIGHAAREVFGPPRFRPFSMPGW